MVVEGEALREGRAAIVIAPESDGVFMLNADAEPQLPAVVAEADRGVMTGRVSLMKKCQIDLDRKPLRERGGRYRYSVFTILVDMPDVQRYRREQGRWSRFEGILRPNRGECR